MKRRKFIQQGSQAGVALSLLGVAACKNKEKTEAAADMPEEMSAAEPFFELSLAQWSIHRMIREDGQDPYAFAEKAAGWGFTGLEYVSQLYRTQMEAADDMEVAMEDFVTRSNAKAAEYGLTNLLIMIDGEGPLAHPDETERNNAIANHIKWVDAAAAMGCHAVRVNLSGSEEESEWIANSIAGLQGLATYAAEKNINVLVENHGGFSSNGALLAQVMQGVAMDNCGTLPDFGNFCIRRKDPSDWSAGCAEAYDIYKGVEELMPYAKAVSAKSHDFDDEGNETEIDYVRMLQIVKDAGYTGYIGVEYEGSELGEEAGILATRDLLLKAAASVS